MNPTSMSSIRSLLADPDRLDRDALFAVLADEQVSEALACLAPPGSLAQIAPAMARRWLGVLDGWERHTDELVGIITDPWCPSSSQMIETWSRIPSAVGVLRDQTDDLVAWAQQRLDPELYADLAALLGPSDPSARLLTHCPESVFIGQTLRRWSMAIAPEAPTEWQAMIDPNLRTALHQSADPASAFPAWGWDPSVDPKTVLFILVDDLFDEWSPDHPSIRRRITWVEHHVDSNLRVGALAFLASIGSSDTLADIVCAHIGHNPSSIPQIAAYVPWSRLHPQIQTVIDQTMRRSSDDRWKRTWACAIGKAPLVPDTTIDAFLLLWRIDCAQWKGFDPSVRNALVSSIIPPDHCYGWGVHPDLVAGRYCPDGRDVRYWNPDVPMDDLRAWAYADGLRAQSTLQKARILIALLDTLPPDRRARFEQIIDVRLGRSPEASPQPSWDWTTWNALPAADRQQRLRDRLAVLWGDRETSPAVRFWRARNDGLATLALMVGEILGLDDPPPILAALLAQVLVLQEDTIDVGSSLPFPNDLDAALRAQIERLPLTRNAQAYAAWGLWLLARDADVGAELLALHPDVAVALAPILTTEERAMVTASPATQGWDSMTNLRWAAACAPAQEPTTLPRQRRMR